MEIKQKNLPSTEANLKSNIDMREIKLEKTTRDLIDEAIAAGKVTIIQPSGLAGNEQTRSTAELIARKRREFRKAARLAAKA